MDNPARTAEHHSRMKDRLGALTELLATLVPAAAPFVWEVGCGHGHFLTAYAAAHPREVCIGVDITKDRIDRGLRKRNRAKLSQLHFVHADARDFLAALPMNASFGAIYVLFPDPWPKRRHHKNRIMQDEFLGAVAKRAGQGTPLYFRTDYEPYFVDTKRTVEKHPDWEIVAEAWPFEHETVFQSRSDSHHSLIARRR